MNAKKIKKEMQNIEELKTRHLQLSPYIIDSVTLQ